MNAKVNTQKIKQLREQRGWSQDQLAHMSGISLRTLQRMEKDGNSSIESVKSVASVFEVDFKEILQEEDSKKFEGVDFLFRIEHGKQVADLIGGKHATDCDFDLAITEKGALEIVHSFFQSIADYNDIWEDIEYVGRSQAIVYFQELIEEIQKRNLWIFGGTTKRKYGDFKPSLIFDVLVIRVHPINSPTIIKVDLEKANVTSTTRNEF